MLMWLDTFTAARRCSRHVRVWVDDWCCLQEEASSQAQHAQQAAQQELDHHKAEAQATQDAVQASLHEQVPATASVSCTDCSRYLTLPATAAA